MLREVVGWIAFIVVLVIALYPVGTPWRFPRGMFRGDSFDNWDHWS